MSKYYTLIFLYVTLSQVGSEKITRIYRKIPTKKVENYTEQYNETSYLKCAHICSKILSCKAFNQQQNKEVVSWLTK